MNNSPLTRVHSRFVENAISELLEAGAVNQVNKCNLVICSPLHVVDNGRKLRLIVDLRYLNSFLHVPKFKVDDLKALTDLFQAGDYMVKFDLKSAYHHVEIAAPTESILVLSGTVLFTASVPFRSVWRLTPLFLTS